MNTKWYLGLDNRFTYLFGPYGSVLPFPYFVNEKLRETPLLEDPYLKRAIGKGKGDEYFFEYINPIKYKRTDFYAYLDNTEYQIYTYVRKNAFRTPYGIMVLLENINSCHRSFILTDDSLLPKSRKILYADSTMYHQVKPSNIYFATFFADYIMERIFLQTIRRIIASCKITNTTITPVIFNYNNMAYDEVPINSFMVFRDLDSYNLYMLSVNTFLQYGMPLNQEKVFLNIDQLRIISCTTINTNGNIETL